MGLFWAAHGWEGSKKTLLLKICHPYPTTIKFGTVILYLKKNRNVYKSPDAPLEFYINKYRYRLHYNA